MIQPDIKVEGLLSRMVQFSAATGRVVGSVMRDQARLFVGDVVKLTPPFASWSGRESFGLQRKAGEEAVRRDILRVFVPMERLGVFSSESGVGKALRDAVRRNDGATVDVLLERSGYLRGGAEVSMEVVPDDHGRQRNRRGRVRRGPRRVFVRERGLKAYLKEKVGMVGFLKSGWVAAARAFGVALPGWITRHAGPGSAVDESSRRNNPEIRMRNAVGYVGVQNEGGRIVNEALRRRDQAMARQIEAKLNGRF